VHRASCIDNEDVKSFSIALAVVLAAASQAAAQDLSEIRRLFEAGQYSQVVEATTPESDPAVVYTAAQSQQKLGADEAARELYARLAARPEGDPWRLIGASSLAMLDGQNDAAMESAAQAAAAAGDLPEAHYHLGLVHARRQEWNEAAAAFDRAAALNPANAYAHYYGGMMHNRAGRTADMAVHFEQFLKLAPQAPERPEVLQIMRTIRGR
jgi:tetratricopeptide (TPR) repeat protein